MSIRPDKLVRDLAGRPQPPHEIIRTLQQYDPRIGLFYTNVSWAITEAWRETDPRREWIQLGHMPADMAFDICGYLPVDCSLDQAMAYIERELHSYTAEQFSALRAAVNQHNTARQDQVMEQTVLGAVSNDLDASNIVTPGISEAVGIQLMPETPKPMTNIEKARAQRMANIAARKASGTA